MKLYYTQRSPYARKVIVMAMEKNIPLELINQDLVKKSPELMAANPLGKIPVLILENGETIVDSPVICEYLEYLKPEPRMIPQDVTQKIHMLHIAAIADGIMEAAIAAYMEKQRHAELFHKNFVKLQEDAVLRAYAYLETQFKILSELNMASIAAACAIGYVNLRLPQLGPRNHNSAVAKWFEEFSKRPSMQKTIPVVS